MTKPSLFTRLFRHKYKVSWRNMDHRYWCRVHIFTTYSEPDAMISALDFIRQWNDSPFNIGDPIEIEIRHGKHAYFSMMTLGDETKKETE